MRALDYFAMKASYLEVHRGSLSSAIKALDFAKMALNRLLKSSEDNLLSLWVGKVKPTHIEHTKGTKDRLSEHLASGGSESLWVGR